MQTDTVVETKVEAATHGFVTKSQLARAVQVSNRTIENWAREKKIPVIRTSARCVRFHLPSVVAALRRFEVNAVS
jgi:hypothetical protein